MSWDPFQGRMDDTRRKLILNQSIHAPMTHITQFWAMIAAQEEYEGIRSLDATASVAHAVTYQDQKPYLSFREGWSVALWLLCMRYRH